MIWRAHSCKLRENRAVCEKNTLNLIIHNNFLDYENSLEVENTLCI